MIKGWGGAQMIVETAHKNETEAYLSVIERTYAAFKPPEFGPQFNPDMEDLAQNQVQNQVRMRSPLIKLLHAFALPNASLLCRSAQRIL